MLIIKQLELNKKWDNLGIKNNQCENLIKKSKYSNS